MAEPLGDECRIGGLAYGDQLLELFFEPVLRRPKVRERLAEDFRAWARGLLDRGAADRRNYQALDVRARKPGRNRGHILGGDRYPRLPRESEKHLAPALLGRRGEERNVSFASPLTFEIHREQ